MRTFSLHSTDAFGLLNGHDGTSQTVHNRLWWVLWHANELNAAAPTDSRPNTWGSRLVRSVPCDCRVKAGGQWGGGRGGVEVDGWWFSLGRLRWQLRVATINTHSRQTENGGKDESDQLRDSVGIQKWRTEANGEQNRIEWNRKNNNKFLIVKNAFVLMPRKTHRKLTGWLCGAVVLVAIVAVWLWLWLVISSLDNVRNGTKWTRTHMSTPIDRCVTSCGQPVFTLPLSHCHFHWQNPKKKEKETTKKMRKHKSFFLFFTFTFCSAHNAYDALYNSLSLAIYRIL